MIKSHIHSEDCDKIGSGWFTLVVVLLLALAYVSMAWWNEKNAQSSAVSTAKKDCAASANARWTGNLEAYAKVHPEVWKATYDQCLHAKGL